MTWETVRFADAFTDVTAKSPRIKLSEFATAGTYPVRDQGERDIAGYWNDASTATKVTRPLILFGDHTRRVKYAAEDFVIGADGVKVLEPSLRLEPRFAFHWMRSLEVPSAGYSRHFKFLREHRVPLPPLSEQRRIAAILDEADGLRARRTTEIQLLDQSVDTRVESIIRSAPTTRRLSQLVSEPLRNGISPARGGRVQGEVLTLSAITHGSFDPSAVKSDVFTSALAADKEVREGLHLICRGNGNQSLVGSMAAVPTTMPGVAFPDTMIAMRPSSVISSPTLLAAWRSRPVREQIRRGARTTNGTFKINQQLLAGIAVPIPSSEGQREIDAIEAERASTASRLNASLTLANTLFASLQHRAFRGEL